jgi:hypothetical protein
LIEHSPDPLIELERELFARFFDVLFESAQIVAAGIQMVLMQFVNLDYAQPPLTPVLGNQLLMDADTLVCGGNVSPIFLRRLKVPEQLFVPGGSNSAVTI